MFLFLDFDGVLRRVTSPPSRFDPDCLECFESAVRQCPEARLVICSAWRIAVPLGELRLLFSPDVGVRIVGVTPEIQDDEAHARYREVRGYLRKRGLAEAAWVAIDDDAEHYPSGTPLLRVDPVKGFDAECAVRLLERLRASA